MKNSSMQGFTLRLRKDRGEELIASGEAAFQEGYTEEIARFIEAALVPGVIDSREAAAMVATVSANVGEGRRRRACESWLTGVVKHVAIAGGECESAGVVDLMFLSLFFQPDTELWLAAAKRKAARGPQRQVGLRVKTWTHVIAHLVLGQQEDALRFWNANAPQRLTFRSVKVFSEAKTRLCSDLGIARFESLKLRPTSAIVAR